MEDKVQGGVQRIPLEYRTAAVFMHGKGVDLGMANTVLALPTQTKVGADVQLRQRHIRRVANHVSFRWKSPRGAAPVAEDRALAIQDIAAQFDRGEQMQSIAKEPALNNANGDIEKMCGPAMNIEVSAFYKFAPLPQFETLRGPLRAFCVDHGIRGTVLLAAEGINGTIAGAPAAMAAVLTFIRNYPEFHDLDVKTSFASAMPFQRMKVRLKKEIVTLGVPGIDPNQSVGHYVRPEDWNALISAPGVVVIDTRNGFEVAAGTFKGAIDPGTTSFGEFPSFVRSRLANAKTSKIAMFCTGGIRCEKATSFLLNEGFEQVFHLKGGILKYLEVVPPEQSLWQGSCFVFDERVGLEHGLVEAADEKV